MSETMVERVAKIIYDITAPDGAGTFEHDSLHRSDSVAAARAAIEAMREPTHEMMRATWEAMFEDKFDGSTAPMVGAGWEAGIDAALKE